MRVDRNRGLPKRKYRPGGSVTPAALERPRLHPTMVAASPEATMAFLPVYAADGACHAVS